MVEESPQILASEEKAITTTTTKKINKKSVGIRSERSLEKNVSRSFLRRFSWSVLRKIRIRCTTRRYSNAQLKV